MPKTFRYKGVKYGLDPLVPTQQIRWIVGKMHISETEASIEEAMRMRMETWHGVNDRIKLQVVLYAQSCHLINQKLYRSVMLGGRV